MNYVSLVLLIVALLFAGNAQADTLKSRIAATKQPITLKAKASDRFNVVFNHSSHKGINCFTCHHKAGEKGRYVPCSSCHKDIGRSKDPLSVFMAFHDKKSSHSCLACHRSLAKENPEMYGKTFHNCRPCHQPPAKSATK